MSRILSYTTAVLIISLAFISLSCNSKNDKTSLYTVDSLLDMEADTVGQQFMKGYELYVWKQRDTVNYTLLPGTNRLKSSKEIYESRETVNDLDDIKSQIDKIEQGQYVSLQPIGIDTTQLLSLKEYILKRGINTAIVPRPLND